MMLMADQRKGSKPFLEKLLKASMFTVFLILVLLLAAVTNELVSAGSAVPENQKTEKHQGFLFQVPSLQERVSQALAPVPLTGLDPHYSWEQNRGYLLSELYYFLFEYDHYSQEIKPQLADDLPDIKQDEKGRKEYIFKISPGHRFVSGREIEARDVKYSLLRLLILDVPESGAGYLWQTIFGVSCLEGFVEEKIGYGSPKDLSSKESLEVFHSITERIFIREDDELVVRPTEDYNLTYLFSDLVPWAAVVDREAVKNLGGWDGRPESWAFYHRTRGERRPPLQESNRAGRYELRVINYQPGRTINLQRISADGERAGIIAVFTPRRAGVARAIEEDLYDFIQLNPSQQERYLQSLKQSSILAGKLSVSDSKIYLISGEKYLEDKAEVELIYYHENQEHRRLAQEVREELKAEGIKSVLRGLNWQRYTASLYRGDFELAVMEWLHPFPREIIPELLTRDRHLAENVEVLELLEKSRRYLYGEF